jgi:hypothetical protein
MSRDFKCHPLDDFNGWADYWWYRIGVNIIPADTRNKANYQSWSEWQNKPVLDKPQNEWKKTAAFTGGIADVPRRVWHNKEKFGFQIRCLCKSHKKEGATID